MDLKRAWFINVKNGKGAFCFETRTDAEQMALQFAEEEYGVGVVKLYEGSQIGWVPDRVGTLAAWLRLIHPSDVPKALANSKNGNSTQIVSEPTQTELVKLEKEAELQHSKNDEIRAAGERIESGYDVLIRELWADFTQD